MSVTQPALVLGENMLNAKEAKMIADEAGQTESHVADYVNYLLSEIESRASKNEYNMTIMSTRSNAVTAKTVKALQNLGYETEIVNSQVGNPEIFISWEAVNEEK